MKPKKFDALIPLAAEYEPDTAASELGFETRLLARLREMRGANGGSFFEILATWSWRSAFGLAPVAVGAAVFLFVAHGLSLSLPAGAEEFVGYLTAWLPGKFF